MASDKGERIFNRIAPIYNWFYKKQIKKYRQIVKDISEEFDISSFNSIIDIGCGTGAFCAVANDMGIETVGIDIATNMIDIAEGKKETKGVKFYHANVLEGLPFYDNTFDIAFAAYVAHGLSKENRIKMYIEMKRIAKSYIIFHDFNQNRTPLISFIEWLEGGDYFRFIKVAKKEMESCVDDMKKCFANVEKINVSKRAAWYICELEKE